MIQSSLEPAIIGLYDLPSTAYTNEHRELFTAFLAQLATGTIRAAEPDSTAPSGWRANAWVKRGILLGFRLGQIVDMTGAGPLPFVDKSTFPVQHFDPARGVRIVPGGSSIRSGAYVGRGVICAPPMFINVGAYVDEGTMVDSHALVGSCAQIGKRCHLSAAAQIGGVLEPVGALPVIVEDDVLVGGNCGIYEGTVVKRLAVLGSGCIINRSTPIFDLVRKARYAATSESPLIVPEGAVVVPGSRRISSGFGAEAGLSINTPIIVKYRDDNTDTRVELESILR